MIFLNRKHAGQRLAEKLLKFKEPNLLLLALPRGGVAVAVEVAKKLNTSLDVLIVRKIGAPNQPELALGALCEDDPPLWNEENLSWIGLRPSDLRRTVAAESKKISDQKRTFRKDKPLTGLHGAFVIIIDDGLATGSTVQAAVQYLRKSGVSKVVVAVPVAASHSARELRKKVDDVVVVEEAEGVMAVGQWYEDFSQVPDLEVIRLLSAIKKHPEAPDSLERPDSNDQLM